MLDSGGADGWGRAFVRAHSSELRHLAPGAGPALDGVDFTARKAGRWSQVVERALAARQGCQASGGFDGVLTTDQSWSLHGDPPPIFPLAFATVVERVLSRPIGHERAIWESSLQMGVPDLLTEQGRAGETPGQFARRVGMVADLFAGPGGVEFADQNYTPPLHMYIKGVPRSLAAAVKRALDATSERAPGVQASPYLAHDNPTLTKRLLSLPASLSSLCRSFLTRLVGGGTHSGPACCLLGEAPRV